MTADCKPNQQNESEDRRETIAEVTQQLMSLADFMSYNESYLGEPRGLLKALAVNLKKKMTADYSKPAAQKDALSIVSTALLVDMFEQKVLTTDGHGSVTSSAQDIVIGVLSLTAHENLLTPKPDKIMPVVTEEPPPPVVGLPAADSAEVAKAVNAVHSATTAVDPADLTEALSKADLDYAEKFQVPYWKGRSADPGAVNPYDATSKEHSAFEFGRQARAQSDLKRQLQR
jgi:hypothetical protein